MFEADLELQCKELEFHKCHLYLQVSDIKVVPDLEMDGVLEDLYCPRCLLEGNHSRVTVRVMSAARVP